MILQAHVEMYISWKLTSEIKWARILPFATNSFQIWNGILSVEKTETIEQPQLI